MKQKKKRTSPERQTVLFHLTDASSQVLKRWRLQLEHFCTS
ncbi:hypothetical protein ACTJJD_03140 [Bacillus sp. 22446]